MVQLPATAAIELLSGGLMPVPQVQCVYEPSRLSVPSFVA